MTDLNYPFSLHFSVFSSSYSSFLRVNCEPSHPWTVQHVCIVHNSSSLVSESDASPSSSPSEHTPGRVAVRLGHLLHSTRHNDCTWEDSAQ